MKFEIQFVPLDYIVFKRTKFSIGLHTIDQIRRQTGKKIRLDNLYVEDVSHHHYYLKVPIDKVKEIPHFKHHSVVTVTVPSCYLNRFTKWKVKGFLFETHITPEVDDKQVLDAWITAGCPLQWNVDDPKKVLIFGESKPTHVNSTIKGIIDVVPSDCEGVVVIDDELTSIKEILKHFITEDDVINLTSIIKEIIDGKISLYQLIKKIKETEEDDD